MASALPRPSEIPHQCLGRPGEGEYSLFINAQQCKFRREKLKEKSSDFILKEKIRRRNGRKISEEIP